MIIVGLCGLVPLHDSQSLSMSNAMRKATSPRLNASYACNECIVWVRLFEFVSSANRRSRPLVVEDQSVWVMRQHNCAT